MRKEFLLSNVRVIEVADGWVGPWAGMLLADLGAEVIKVEPKTGDLARGFMSIIGVSLGIKGRDFYFEYNNRNKRGIVLNLKQEKRKEVFSS